MLASLTLQLSQQWALYLSDICALNQLTLEWIHYWHYRNQNPIHFNVEYICLWIKCPILFTPCTNMSLCLVAIGQYRPCLLVFEIKDGQMTQTCISPTVRSPTQSWSTAFQQGPWIPFFSQAFIVASFLGQLTCFCKCIISLMFTFPVPHHLSLAFSVFLCFSSFPPPFLRLKIGSFHSHSSMRAAKHR